MFTERSSRFLVIEFMITHQRTCQNVIFKGGLLLLTLRWSYIFSVRFWDLRGKQLSYTSNVLQL